MAYCIHKEADMATKREQGKATTAYRRAAKKLFGANDTESRSYIKSPADDPGEWAPEALVIIYLEPDFRFPEDTGVIPDRLSYYGDLGFDNCIALAEAAGVGYVEYINAAVAAVYPT
jgi:hypothetical protein